MPGELLDDGTGDRWSQERVAAGDDPDSASNLLRRWADLGSARLGKIIFPGGTIRISHHAGRGTASFKPRTCLAIISQPGTYKIVGGTGKYAGISGHGKYRLSLAFIGARAKGQCSSAKAPVARQELLRLSGSVHL